MSLIDTAKADAQFIVSDANGFTVPVVFTSLGSPAVTVTVNAVPVRHSTQTDEHYIPIIGPTARITVSEKALTDLGYPTRDSSGNLILKGNYVSWTLANGTTYNGVVNKQQPDMMAGIIVLTINDKTP